MHAMAPGVTIQAPSRCDVEGDHETPTKMMRSPFLYPLLDRACSCVPLVPTAVLAVLLIFSFFALPDNRAASKDFAQHEITTTFSSIFTSGTDCFISTTEEVGLATVTVRNSDNNNSRIYTVVTECEPYFDSRYAVADISPSTPQLLTVGANSLSQLNPAISFRLVDVTDEGLNLYYPEDENGLTPTVCGDSQGVPCATADTTIGCTFTIYPGTTVNGCPEQIFMALCTDVSPSPASQGSSNEA